MSLLDNVRNSLSGPVKPRRAVEMARKASTLELPKRAGVAEGFLSSSPTHSLLGVVWEKALEGKTCKFPRIGRAPSPPAGSGRFCVLLIKSPLCTCSQSRATLLQIPHFTPRLQPRSLQLLVFPLTHAWLPLRVCAASLDFHQECSCQGVRITLLRQLRIWSLQRTLDALHSTTTKVLFPFSKISEIVVVESAETKN